MEQKSFALIMEDDKEADKLEEKIVVVDSKDNIIGAEKRDMVDREGLLYRVSAIWIKNSKGENLLASCCWNRERRYDL